MENICFPALLLSGGLAMSVVIGIVVGSVAAVAAICGIVAALVLLL